MRKQLSFKTDIAKAKIEKILNLISTKQLTNKQISELIHINSKHCKVYINHLLANKQIYISSWRKEQTEKGFSCNPYYRKGNIDNAQKPKPKSKTEINKRYITRRQKDKERHELHLHKRRLNYAKKKIQPKQDWVSFWIKPNNQQGLNNGSPTQSS